MVPHLNDFKEKQAGTELKIVWAKKNFGRKIFWSESIQNVSKRILNRKSRNRKFFPCKIFFVGLSRFSAKMAKIVKK